jgi:hypothetical protein
MMQIQTISLSLGSIRDTEDHPPGSFLPLQAYHILEQHQGGEGDQYQLCDEVCP